STVRTLGMRVWVAVGALCFSDVAVGTAPGTRTCVGVGVAPGVLVSSGAVDDCGCEGWGCDVAVADASEGEATEVPWVGDGAGVRVGGGRIAIESGAGAGGSEPSAFA